MNPTVPDLSDLLERRTIVVGVGNPLMGDDGAGSRIAARLAPAGHERVIDGGATPENELGPLLDAAPDAVLFVDACEFGGEPGAMCRIRAGLLAPAAGSTHGMSLLLLARILEHHGIDCWVLGIQPASRGLGAAPSAAVEAAERAIVAALAPSLAGEEAPHA